MKAIILINTEKILKNKSTVFKRNLIRLGLPYVRIFPDMFGILDFGQGGVIKKVQMSGILASTKNNVQVCKKAG